MNRNQLSGVLILAFLLVLAPLGCGEEEEDNTNEEYGEIVDLSGTWVAEGYDCPPDFNAAELIEIEISGDDLLANKTVGDECVPTGMDTLRATLPDEVRVGMTLDTESQVSTGSSFEWVDSEVEIISVDEFIVPLEDVVGQGAIRFYRSSSENLDTVDIDGEWQNWGYTCNSTTRLLQAVDVETSEDTVTATKTIGDDCIEEGEVTWEATRDGATLDGEIFSTVGSDPVTIEILAHDFMLLTITGEDVDFYFWRLP